MFEPAIVIRTRHLPRSAKVHRRTEERHHDPL